MNFSDQRTMMTSHNESLSDSHTLVEGMYKAYYRRFWKEESKDYLTFVKAQCPPNFNGVSNYSVIKKQPSSFAGDENSEELRNLLHNDSGVFGRSEMMQPGIQVNEEDQDMMRPVNMPFKSEKREEGMIPRKEVNFNKKAKAPLDEDFQVREEVRVEVRSKVDVVEAIKGGVVGQEQIAVKLQSKDVVEKQQMEVIEVVGKAVIVSDIKEAIKSVKKEEEEQTPREWNEVEEKQADGIVEKGQNKDQKQADLIPSVEEKGQDKNEEANVAEEVEDEKVVESGRRDNGIDNNDEKQDEPSIVELGVAEEIVPVQAGAQIEPQQEEAQQIAKEEAQPGASNVSEGSPKVSQKEQKQKQNRESGQEEVEVDEDEEGPSFYEMDQSKRQVSREQPSLEDTVLPTKSEVKKEEPSIFSPSIPMGDYDTPVNSKTELLFPMKKQAEESLEGEIKKEEGQNGEQDVIKEEVRAEEIKQQVVIAEKGEVFKQQVEAVEEGVKREEQEKEEERDEEKEEDQQSEKQEEKDQGKEEEDDEQEEKQPVQVNRQLETKIDGLATDFLSMLDNLQQCQKCKKAKEQQEQLNKLNGELKDHIKLLLQQDDLLASKNDELTLNNEELAKKGQQNSSKMDQISQINQEQKAEISKLIELHERLKNAHFNTAVELQQMTKKIKNLEDKQKDYFSGRKSGRNKANRELSEHDTSHFNAGNRNNMTVPQREASDDFESEKNSSEEDSNSSDGYVSPYVPKHNNQDSKAKQDDSD